jgi:SAM-dependent methyltransferase
MTVATLENTVTWDHSAWNQHTPSEVKFWDQWIMKEGHHWPEDYKRRTDPQAPVTQLMLDLIGELDVDLAAPLQIMDIGSGPLSYVGYVHDKFAIDLTVVDPLADEYNRLLDQANVVDVPRPQPGYFETALATFGENSFDAVWCFNSLDHFIDPVHGLFNLLSVVKIGGGLVLSLHPNEAEQGDYGGLHQWNLDVDGEGLLLNQKGKQMRLQGLIAQQKVVKRIDYNAKTGVKKERITYLIKKTANVNLSQALLT